MKLQSRERFWSDDWRPGLLGWRGIGEFGFSEISPAGWAMVA
jgi:hypothetical protein